MDKQNYFRGLPIHDVSHPLVVCEKGDFIGHDRRVLNIMLDLAARVHPQAPAADRIEERIPTIQHIPTDNTTLSDAVTYLATADTWSYSSCCEVVGMVVVKHCRHPQPPVKADEKGVAAALLKIVGYRPDKYSEIYTPKQLEIIQHYQGYFDPETHALANLYVIAHSLCVELRSRVSDGACWILDKENDIVLVRQILARLLREKYSGLDHQISNTFEVCGNGRSSKWAADQALTQDVLCSASDGVMHALENAIYNVKAQCHIDILEVFAAEPCLQAASGEKRFFIDTGALVLGHAAQLLTSDQRNLVTSVLHRLIGRLTYRLHDHHITPD